MARDTMPNPDRGSARRALHRRLRQQDGEPPPAAEGLREKLVIFAVFCVVVAAGALALGMGWIG